MEIAFLLAVALVTAVLAAVLGSYLNGWMGGALLAVLALAAWGICIAGYFLLGWPGLLLGALLASVVAALLGRKLFQRRGMLVLPSWWLSFFLTCTVGYLVGGRLGLLTITMGAALTFWLSLFLLSRYILPLNDNSQRGQAFHSLLTFTLGSNYSYYVIEEREAHRKEAHVTVEGNRFRTFLAGPGIVLTGCDHSIAVSDGIKFPGASVPGLTFTGLFQSMDQVIDLRPQLRAFDVEAITKDGILIKVLTFIPFKIDDGGRQPELGEPFPFDKKAAFRAIYDQPIEHKREKKEDPVEKKQQTVENLEKVKWDYLVPAIGRRIVQDIISRYAVDELCAADDPARDPRAEIKRELQERMKREMEPWGIKVLGGGISNLLPQDEGVKKRRIENWQAEWKRKAMLAGIRGRARKERFLGQAQAKARADTLRIIAEGYARAVDAGDRVLSNMMAFCLVEAMEKVLTRREEGKEERKALPPSSEEQAGG
jgi:regulator of protease activity HflC (stomatin/prohibitin superfamily)